MRLRFFDGAFASSEPGARLRERVHAQGMVQAILPVLVFVVALALYWRTAAPSLLTGDQAEHQMMAAILGVPHATGYPLFTLLNALAVRLPLAADLARRVTLMTALWSALAVMLAFIVTRKLTGRSLAALLAAASLAVSSEFWSLSVIAEVYTFQALLILLVWSYLLDWWAAPDSPRPLYLAALCAGIAISHHGSFVPIVGPALLLVVALPLLGAAGLSLRRWGRRGEAQAALPSEASRAGSVIWRCLACGALGLTPWLYLAAQFALFHPFDYYRGEGLPYHYYWGNPTTWADVLNLALGGGFRGKVFTHGWAHIATLSVQFVGTLRQEFWWHGFLLGALGGIVLLLRQPRAGMFSCLIFLGAVLFGINVAGDVPKAHVYYLPAYVIWSVWIGVAAAWLADAPRRLLAYQPVSVPLRARGLVVLLPTIGLVALITLPLLLGWRRFDRIDRSTDTMPRRMAAGVLAEVEPNAVILCRWELCRPIQYIQLVEHQRLDVQLDQTEPESGSDWGQRAALYLGQHPVYALELNTQLAERYQIYPISETYDLWQVHATQ
jgi:hypothetical protein